MLMWVSSYWQRIKYCLERVFKMVELLHLILVIAGIYCWWMARDKWRAWFPPKN